MRRHSQPLSSAHGDLVGYDYFTDKQAVSHGEDFVAQFLMPTFSESSLHLNLWMKGYPGRQLFTVMAPPSRAINSASVPKSLYKQKLPTLVVRQPGEAKTRPFVSIMEAFRSEEGESIKEVIYFSPKIENPGCVGIAVRSHQDKVDYLFHDESGEQVNTVDKHAFQGTFGLISYEGTELRSLFLGDGKMLESGPWKIESKEAGNTVLVQDQADKLVIQAQHPFQLTIPLRISQQENIVLESITESGKQIYPGTIRTHHYQWIAVFDLPAMAPVQLSIKSDK